MKHTIVITGAAGYVGAMLVRNFANREDVEKIVGIDKEPMPEFLGGISKLWYIEADSASLDWTEVARVSPDVVINAAWQIRELYGKKEEQWKLNVEGSDAVFDFAFNTHSVKRFIHFSTVASYGARPSNTIEHHFKEEEGFRKSDYLYAEEKRISEVHLEEKYAETRDRGNEIKVAIIRPAAITGPRGRFMRIRFGLQSALSGQLKENFIHRLISLMVSFVPVTKNWCRQFIHEDDIVAITALLAFGNLKTSYEAFNACPSGEVVRGKDMAKAVGKRAIRIHPLLIRLVFFVMWHLSLGRVPTSKGGWKSYSYPIAVDGSKLTSMYGYKYTYPCLDAFYYTNGAYEDFVPKELRRHKN